jgi:AcrR family transcriptional regulator
MTTKTKPEGMRERLLAAAVRVLGKHGLRKLTQPQVAREAGVRQSHLTYYFPHRSDLIAAVARHHLLSVGEEVARLMASGSSEAIAEALIELTRGLVKNRRRTRILIGLLVASEEDKALRKQLVESVLAVRSVVEQVLGLPEAHPHAALLEAVLLGVGVQHLLLEGHPREAQTDQLLATIAELFPLGAVGSKKTKKKKRRET